MSLEDLNEDFQSDESDHEAELEVEVCNYRNENHNEMNYIDLLLLYSNLTTFRGIYFNNVIIDMEAEREVELRLNSNSLPSDLALLEEYIENIFDNASHEGEQTSDGEYSDLRCIRDLIQLFQEVVSVSSSNSPTLSNSSSRETSSTSSQTVFNASISEQSSSSLPILSDASINESSPSSSPTGSDASINESSPSSSPTESDTSINESSPSSSPTGSDASINESSSSSLSTVSDTSTSETNEDETSNSDSEEN
ncbi:putative protein TPRXL [Kryptolebias marmoratus]|uniref:putative protein TPRXL n=1 Tax=Kryptolebias marmoratus TaxID=37003 RepID=UPI0018AC9F50|nr:putative protein TPRXL [Kryptolebias marmoratus]